MGIPRKDRMNTNSFLVEDVQSIRLELQDNFSSRGRISIRLKNQQDVALTQQKESFNLREMEEKAAQLARFLRVPIEGF